MNDVLANYAVLPLLPTGEILPTVTIFSDVAACTTYLEVTIRLCVVKPKWLIPICSRFFLVFSGRQRERSCSSNQRFERQTGKKKTYVRNISRLKACVSRFESESYTRLQFPCFVSARSCWQLCCPYILLGRRTDIDRLAKSISSTIVAIRRVVASHYISLRSILVEAVLQASP